MWFDETLRLEGMLDWARQEGRDEVEQRLAEAERKRQEDKKEIAGKLKLKGKMSIADIAETTGLSFEEVEKA